MWLARFGWEFWQAQEDALWRRDACVYRAEEGAEGCLYLAQDERPTAVPARVSLVRLQPLIELAGASAGADAPWHYVVATDVLAEHEDDFNAWYDREHLPGLAGVPGTARAVRYRASDGEGPRYYACYDLADRAAFGSAAWMAVRATDWSSRIRPSFRNTRRTMYRRVGDLRVSDLR